MGYNPGQVVGSCFSYGQYRNFIVIIPCPQVIYHGGHCIHARISIEVAQAVFEQNSMDNVAYTHDNGVEIEIPSLLHDDILFLSITPSFIKYPSTEVIKK